VCRSKVGTFREDHNREEKDIVGNKDALRLPVVSLSAEYLVIGQLMRRNILAYKAPPNNQGYDLICIHPDPKKSSRAIRVQVKSRYQTDCDRAFPVKAKTFGAFDYLIVVFLNIGFFFRRVGQERGRQAPEYFTLPRQFIQKHHYRPPSGFQKVMTKGLDISAFKDELGFELIARDLRIPYPSR
jgi:hypothetical protein